MIEDPVVLVGDLQPARFAELRRRAGDEARRIEARTGLVLEVRAEGFAALDVDGGCSDVLARRLYWWLAGAEDHGTDDRPILPWSSGAARRRRAREIVSRIRTKTSQIAENAGQQRVYPASVGRRGREVRMLSPSGPSPGGSFRIDLDHAPEAIKELEAARQELIAIRNEAVKLGKVDPGSADSVSIDAAALLSATAVSGPASFVAALTAGIEQVEQVIDTMTEDLRDHQATEDRNVAAFRS